MISYHVLKIGISPITQSLPGFTTLPVPQSTWSLSFMKQLRKYGKCLPLIMPALMVPSYVSSRSLSIDPSTCQGSLSLNFIPVCAFFAINLPYLSHHSHNFLRPNNFKSIDSNPNTKNTVTAKLLFWLFGRNFLTHCYGGLPVICCTQYFISLPRATSPTGKNILNEKWGIRSFIPSKRRWWYLIVACIPCCRWKGAVFISSIYCS